MELTRKTTEVLTLTVKEFTVSNDVCRKLGVVLFEMRTMWIVVDRSNENLNLPGFLIYTLIRPAPHTITFIGVYFNFRHRKREAQQCCS